MRYQFNLHTRKIIVCIFALLLNLQLAYPQTIQWGQQNIFEGGSTNIFESNPEGALLLPSDSNLFNGQGSIGIIRDSNLTRSFDQNLYGNSNPGGPGSGGGTIDDAAIPVDGGLSVILVVGAAMGLRKRAGRKKFSR